MAQQGSPTLWTGRANLGGQPPGGSGSGADAVGVGATLAASPACPHPRLAGLVCLRPRSLPPAPHIAAEGISDDYHLPRVVHQVRIGHSPQMGGDEDRVPLNK